MNKNGRRYLRVINSHLKRIALLASYCLEHNNITEEQKQRMLNDIDTIVNISTRTLHCTSEELVYYEGDKTVHKMLDKIRRNVGAMAKYRIERIHIDNPKQYTFILTHVDKWCMSLVKLIDKLIKNKEPIEGDE